MPSTRTHEAPRATAPRYRLGSFIIAQFDRCIELSHRRASSKDIPRDCEESRQWRDRKIESVEGAMTDLLNPTNYPEFYRLENIGNSQTE